jgi:hypothetical protein
MRNEREFTKAFLQVNNHNVAVLTDNKVDSLSFQLLSIKPKYDIENYLAPSLNPSSAPYSPIKKIDKTKTKKPTENKDKKSTKGKRGRPAKEKEDEPEPAKKNKVKGKKGAQKEAEIDKENVPVNRETRSKRTERVKYTEVEEEGEEEEEVLRGPRTKMFTEVAV